MRWIKVAILGLFLLPVGAKIGLFRAAVGNKANIRPMSRGSLDSNSITASASWNLYDPDPSNVCNRLYRSLYRREGPDGREYGYDELDPLLWSGTKYLLINPANQQAITILDEFLSIHAERGIRDPLKRATLQRDLWAIFDWTARAPIDTQWKLDLQSKLARAMNRVALSPDEIASLPATYSEGVKSKAFATGYDPNKREQPFLPPDILDPNGSWVSLSSGEGFPVAPAHVDSFSGKSVFLVFMRLPEGREATLKYLKKLSEIPTLRFRVGYTEFNTKLWIPDPETPASVRGNPNLPQFPAGTELALVREMVLIDNQGNFRPTNMIESVQIRVHRMVPSEIPQTFFSGASETRTNMDTFEFILSRPKLFAGQSGGLRPILPGERQFAFFQSHGIDWESKVALTVCSTCHVGPGIYSVRSRGGDVVPASDPNQQANEAKQWKVRRYEWALLQRLRQSEPVTFK
ncbi:MAG TPA: hypothetical protein VGO27_08100 [Candidatus Acidoferrum sp.]|jgi:hypothetical protein|nr:hypothetical protein [Candidatus Acidoferrum sp.]